MKKLLIILVVVMGGAIGVLTYIAYPQIKTGWQKRFGSDTQIETEGSRTVQHDNIKRDILSQKISIDKGKTDIERTMIIKYNNVVSILGDLLVACIDNGVDFENIDHINDLPEAVDKEYGKYLRAGFDFDRFYDANITNVRQELLQYFTLLNSN